MEDIRIIKPTGGLIVVLTDECDYECHHDTRTGDWNVVCEDDDTVQGDWMLTRDDAIKFALERAGIVEDGDYTRAPNRVDC